VIPVPPFQGGRNESPDIGVEALPRVVAELVVLAELPGTRLARWSFPCSSCAPRDLPTSFIPSSSLEPRVSVRENALQRGAIARHRSDHSKRPQWHKGRPSGEAVRQHRSCSSLCRGPGPSQAWPVQGVPRRSSPFRLLCSWGRFCKQLAAPSGFSTKQAGSVHSS
jgi:hypothetical protein